MTLDPLSHPFHEEESRQQMSDSKSKGPYIYQPFGMQDKLAWIAGRIYGISGVHLATTIVGLTRSEAESMLRALKEDHTVQMGEKADAEAERKKYEALREERDALAATVERLSAPWTKGVDAFYSERNDTLTGWFDGILAARTTPPAKEPKQ